MGKGGTGRRRQRRRAGAADPKRKGSVRRRGGRRQGACPVGAAAPARRPGGCGKPRAVMAGGGSGQALSSECRAPRDEQKSNPRNHTKKHEKKKHKITSPCFFG